MFAAMKRTQKETLKSSSSNLFSQFFFDYFDKGINCSRAF